MKTQSTSLFSSLSKAELVSLTSEVTETLAMDMAAAYHKKFTAAEVWNIQRRQKARVQRRLVL